MDAAKKIRIGLATLIVGSLALAACGGGDDEAAPANTAITSNRQAAGIAAGGLDDAIDFGTDATASAAKNAAAFKWPRIPNRATADTGLARLISIEDALLAQVQKSAAAARASARTHSGTTTNCTAGGSGQYTTDATHTTYVFTYTACNNGSSIWDGTVTFTQTMDATGSYMTTVYGRGDGVVGNGDDFRITLLASDGTTIEAYIYLDERFDGSITENTAGDTIVSANFNGRVRSDGLDGTRYEVAYHDLRAVMTESSDGLRRRIVYNGSADATLLYAGVTYSSHLGYENFALSANDSGTYVALTLDGTMETATDPARCTDGRYTFVTREALMYNRATGMVESGTIAINDNTVVTFNNGDMVVTVNGIAITYAPGTVGVSCPVN